MKLYSILLLLSILVPFVLSFDKKLQFYKKWKFLLPSILIVALFFIAFDILLTKAGVWGFNPMYHSNYLIFGLPIEECLFFIVIPYASIFLHESVILYFPKFKINEYWSRLITIAIIVCAAIIASFNIEKAYTVYIFSTLILATILSIFDKTLVIQRFYATFLVILIPFVAVNALLTGSFIESEVVWYNNSEIIGFRFLTIPIEDFFYAFSLILLNLLLSERLKLFFQNRKIHGNR